MSGEPSNRDAGRFKLPRKAILRGRKPFDQLFQRGRSLRSPQFDFRFRWVETAEPTVKLAFIVGRRIGNAVQRNRLRRLLREAYRLGAGELREVAIERGRSLEGAFIAKSAQMQLHEIRSVMSDFFQKLGQSPQKMPVKS